MPTARLRTRTRGDGQYVLSDACMYAQPLATLPTTLNRMMNVRLRHRRHGSAVARASRHACIYINYMCCWLTRRPSRARNVDGVATAHRVRVRVRVRVRQVIAVHGFSFR